MRVGEEGMGVRQVGDGEAMAGRGIDINLVSIPSRGRLKRKDQDNASKGITFSHATGAGEKCFNLHSLRKLYFHSLNMIVL